MLQEPTIAASGDDLPLSFDRLLVIVGGGSFDLTLLASLSAGGAALVGADGGGDAIAEAGLIPDAIVGDFDSLADPDDWEPETRLVHIAEQETTDFEKALYSTRAPLTLALGMTGKRFDHTLAALSAVTRFGADRRIMLRDEYDLALSLSGTFSFYAEKGERVSIHPLASVRFARSKGLLYPLDGLTLAPGERIGTSNQALGGEISIEAEPESRGPWLIILDGKHLNRMIDQIMQPLRLALDA